MKRIILAVSILFITGALHAERRQKSSGIEYPQRPTNIVSDAVYMTSVTCVDNSVPGRAVVISTAPSLVFAVNITSGGTGSPLVQLFDSSVSTGAGEGNDPTRTKMRPITPPIDARGSTTFQTPKWSVGTSSGIALWNHGDILPACVSVVYVER